MSNNLQEFKREEYDSVDLWPSRVANAIDFFKQHPRGYRRWKANIELYAGQHYRMAGGPKGLSDVIKKSDSNMGYVTVPITTRTVNSFVPYFTGKNPNFLVKPNNPESSTAAEISTQLMRQEWRDRKMKRQFKKIVKDSLVCGWGVGFVGYNIILKEYAQAENEQKKGLLDYNLHIQQEACVMRRVDPFRFVWEPDSPDYDLDSSRWCAEIILRPRQDVVDDVRYSQDFRDEVKSNATPASTYINKMDKDSSHMKERPDFYENQVILYQIWDKKFLQRHIFADGVGQPADKDPQKWPYQDANGEVYLDRFPYVRLDYMTMVNEQFPMGIPQLIEDQQLQLNRMRTAMFKHIQRSKRLIWVNTEFVSEDVERKIKQDDDMGVIQIKGATGDMAVGAVADAPMSTDYFNGEGIIKQDIRETTGSSEIQRGGNMPSGTTATEIQARQQVLSLNIDDVSDNVNEFIQDVGEIMLKHITANFETPRVVKIVGEIGQYWGMEPDPTNPALLIPKQVTAEDLKGDFELEVESTTKEQTDPQTDKQQRISVAQLLLQNGVPVDPIELTKWMLEPFGYKDVSRFFPPAGAPNVPIAEMPAEQTTTVGKMMQQQQMMNQQAVNPVSNMQGNKGPMGGQ